jgi:hypothetical protein
LPKHAQKVLTHREDHRLQPYFSNWNWEVGTKIKSKQTTLKIPEKYIASEIISTGNDNK